MCRRCGGASRALSVARDGIDDMAGTAGVSTHLRLRRIAQPGITINPTDEQRQVIDHRGRRLKVLAGPGTGKTATLVEAVARRVTDRGVAPEHILVLTFSRRAASELTDRITRRLAITTREPLVRTLHAYAYSLLRAQAVRAGEPAPRLLAAGESDQMVRELLAGQREARRGAWPGELHAALGSPAFAAELRELLLRTAERGISPARLAEMGRRRKRPEWQAAARFAVEYQDVADLRQGSSGFGAALDQAELTLAALALLADDTILAAEQSRVRRIFVDEYQDVDPAQARLVQRLASGADELVVFGDPDQSIYAFRGADAGALRDIEVDDTVSLTQSRRLSPAVLAAARRIAARLPGRSPHRAITSVATDQRAEPGPAPLQLPADGEVLVRTLPTVAREAAFIADQLRRAHLTDGLPWSQMAVLTRSPVVALPALRRAFAHAGVPIAVSGQDDPLVDEPVVAMMLTVLRCGLDPGSLTGQVALDLLSSAAGTMDVATVRRLRRALRTARPGEGPTADLLAAVFAGAPLPAGITADMAGPVRRMTAMVQAARRAAGDPTAENALWQIWRLSALEDGLVASSLRGGRSGQRADVTLDAVVAVFGMAAELADRLAMAGVRAFVDLVEGQRIPGDPMTRPARSADAVAVLSAHAAKGLEWDLVCVAGVTEGRWPVLRARQSLLGVDAVLDSALGLPATLATRTEVIDDERRLFYVAVTRARHRLIATAVEDQDTLASRFLYELSGADELPTGWPAGVDGTDRRGLHLTDLIADLRRAVTDSAVPDRTGELAAAQLARLAAAGVSGAHPDDWYALSDRSTSAPALPAGAAVTISPSAVESLTTCALRGVLERRGGRGSAGQAQIEGIVVHALADGLARGVSRADLVAEMDGFLSRQIQPRWLLARSRRVLTTMLDAALAWESDNYPARTMVGSELVLRAAVPPDVTGPDVADPGDAGHRPDGGQEGRSTDSPARQRPVVLQGRVDRLDRRPDGSVVVVDFKTGATKPTRAQVVENPQLAAYQLAIELGALSTADDDDPGRIPGEPAVHGARPGGAELIHLRTGRPTILTQPPLEPVAGQRWRTVVREAAEQLAASVNLARENGRCDRCPVRSSCPLRPEGRQVTR